MILADKILYHRKRLALSQEELADQLNVSRQSVSKWEGAQSIPDMDKIIRLSDIFSVSIDYLLRDEIQDIEYIDQKDNTSLKSLSLEEANSFIEANEIYSKNVAFAVFLFITSPIVLIFLNLLYENKLIKLSEDFINGLGVIVLIGMVSYAVSILLRNSIAIKPYNHLKEEIFELEYGVESAIKKKYDSYRSQHTRYMTLGVSLIIASVIPLILFELLVSIPLLQSMGPALLLLIVAFGVYLLARTSIYNSSFTIIFQEDDYSPKRKKNNKIHGKIAGIYWLSATTIYLAISFLSNNWDRSWIVWPIAGVLFGVISIITSIFTGD